MKKLHELIEAGKESLYEHPAFKAANGALILQSVRSGSKGYEGPLIGEWVEQFAKEIALQSIEAVSLEEVKEAEHDPTGDWSATIWGLRGISTGWNKAIKEAKQRAGVFLGEGEDFHEVLAKTDIDIPYDKETVAGTCVWGCCKTNQDQCSQGNQPIT